MGWEKEDDIDTLYMDEDGEVVSYTKDNDTYSRFSSYGGLLYLATEGERKRLMTEGPTDYIVVSKGSEDMVYDKEGNALTNYIKTLDA
jgi:hypothetical protein